MGNSIFRRKRSLVDREVQFGLASIILGYLLFYTLFLFALVGAPIILIYTYAGGTDYERMAAIGQFIMEDQRFWLLIAIFIIAVSIHSIFMTRKFAGPIFVFRRHLRRAQNGELSRISLRKGDSFHDLKDLINDHFDQICDTMTKIRSTLDTAIQKIDSMQKGQADEGAKTSSSILSDLRDELAKIDSICRKSWNYSD